MARRRNAIVMPRRRVPLALALRGLARGLAGLGDAGGILSPDEIAQVAANAGFSGADLQTAVAIALAESLPSGNPNSYNPETQAGAPKGQGSFGLWQIYLYKHPEFAGWNLFDPQTNANAAFSIYSKRGGFSDWSTFNSGKYLAYVQPAASSPAPAATSAPAAAPAAPPPPLTIDASTGLPIDDNTPTPGAAPFPTGNVLLWTGVAAAVYLLADFLSD